MDQREEAWRTAQHQLTTWMGNLQWRASLFATHSQGLVALSTVAINSIILANGAASAAILALLGSIWSDPARNQVMPAAVASIKIFAAGVFLAMVTAALGYLGQSCYAAGDDYPSGSRPLKIWYGFGLLMRLVAIVTAGVGIASFGYGAWYGVTALEAAGKLAQ